MRCVLDTNVFVSGLLLPLSAPRRAIDLAREHGSILLSSAISGHATHIVTGDLDLLAMHPFRGIDIVNPRTFVDQAKRQGVHE